MTLIPGVHAATHSLPFLPNPWDDREANMGWMREANTRGNRESSEARGDNTLTPAHRGG
jgi:hypothetical protein